MTWHHNKGEREREGEKTIYWKREIHLCRLGCGARQVVWSKGLRWQVQRASEQKGKWLADALALVNTWLIHYLCVWHTKSLERFQRGRLPPCQHLRFWVTRFPIHHVRWHIHRQSYVFHQERNSPTSALIRQIENYFQHIGNDLRWKLVSVLLPDLLPLSHFPTDPAIQDERDTCT